LAWFGASDLLQRIDTSARCSEFAKHCCAFLQTRNGSAKIPARMLETQKQLLSLLMAQCCAYEQLVPLLNRHIEDLDAQLTEFRCAVSEIITGGYGDPVELAKSARLSDLEAEEKMRDTRRRICELKKTIVLTRN
jgi:hypothetical protein